MTFRTYLPFATAAIAAAVFTVVDGAVGESPDPPSKASVQLVAAPAR